jgi:hypothetical protein
LGKSYAYLHKVCIRGSIFDCTCKDVGIRLSSYRIQRGFSPVQESTMESLADYLILHHITITFQTFQNMIFTTIPVALQMCPYGGRKHHIPSFQPKLITYILSQWQKDAPTRAMSQALRLVCCCVHSALPLWDLLIKSTSFESHIFFQCHDHTWDLFLKTLILILVPTIFSLKFEIHLFFRGGS